MTRRPRWVTLSTLWLVGCAGAAGPIYEFQPTPAPLNYALVAQGDFVIETPMGEQHSFDSTSATIVIEIGRTVPEGREVGVTLEALDVREGGDFSSRRITGEGLIGELFSGTLSPAGKITVRSAPAIPASVQQAMDPADLFSNLLPPLPPLSSAESWPHRQASTSETTMTMENSYEGVARFARDTTWNGRTVRIIISEGMSTTHARGTPEGAPGEVDFTLSGPSITRYIWDPGEGVMLAAQSTSELAGELEVVGMDMTMPIAYTSSAEAILQPR